jgi:hypothetical protein
MTKLSRDLRKRTGAVTAGSGQVTSSAAQVAAQSWMAGRCQPSWPPDRSRGRAGAAISSPSADAADLARQRVQVPTPSQGATDTAGHNVARPR